VSVGVSVPVRVITLRMVRSRVIGLLGLPGRDMSGGRTAPVVG